MTSRLAPLLESCDHNSVFALTYLRTTEEFRRTIDDPSSFSDVGYMVREDALFASFYFDAYDAWKSGRSDDVPQAWAIAFDAARSGEVTGIGDALLGISAHVNRDLPFVLERLGLVTPELTSRKADHDRINDVLGRVVGPMMAEAAKRLDPTIADRQVGGQTFDDAQALEFIVEWRDKAWANAEKLVAAPTPADHAAVAAEIETEAATTSRGVLAATTASPDEETARGTTARPHTADSPIAVSHRATSAAIAGRCYIGSRHWIALSAVSGCGGVGVEGRRGHPTCAGRRTNLLGGAPVNCNGYGSSRLRSLCRTLRMAPPTTEMLL